MAPESARMGEGVIAHRRDGGEGSSPSESYGDSRAANGLGEAKREYLQTKRTYFKSINQIVHLIYQKNIL